ncbi:DUF4190 domain-containing protein [Phycicoccus flavus]|uniref:DUF4190 domain-containing protein n=1 Tax=Phycicoccus flavus TaxID=2502783 RepID=A0A8T6R875_9MICO|nr:DUF4190 domain-containing protein [Phycicoccus flavus]NHA69894.1 DUF4190 domain-containing protein [Phycicoccus flavus]
MSDPHDPDRPPGPPGDDRYPSAPPPAAGPPWVSGAEPQDRWSAPPPGGPQHGGTNGFAIASLVLGLLGVILLSVVFGIVALQQIRRRGQDGRGLAIAGLVLSALWLLVIAAGVAFAITTGATRDGDGGVANAGRVPATSLEVGDCLDGRLEDSQSVTSLPAVPCTEPHGAEVFALFDLPDGEFPGAEEVKRLAEAGCEDRVTVDLADTDASLYFLHPNAPAWRRGDHEVVCVAVLEEAAQAAT